ncbi:MFS transporter [Marivibrio halodurans]|uniref:MFS transporter n=1 Tax=Marivibrio halodurans TaxID=2039722 RepID=A0A8J7V0W6_9PROT|nr:MFS transporter [Marivibrio halodurans]MBP5855720.1 MFS transporter [Marivibrio halodurans]
MQQDRPPGFEPFPHPPVAAEAETGLSARQRRRGLIAVLASLLAAGLTFGTSIPLLALLMERDGVSTTMIGLNSSMPLLATILMSTATPWIVRRLGVIPTLMAGIVLIVVGFLGMAAFRSLEAWFVLRFLVGVGMSVHWVISETWLNSAAKPGNRGLMAGLYAALMGIGFAGGPAMLTILPIDGWTPFLVIIGFVALAAVPILWAAGAAPRLDLTSESGRWSALRLAPTIFLAIFVSGLVDTAMLSLLPIYGLRHGLAQEEAVLLLSVAVAGTVVLQAPLGLLADRVNRRALLLIVGTVGLAGALLLPLVLAETWLRWPLLFIWGGTVAGLYTVALADLGARFEGGALAAANALFVMNYCIGSLLGPSVAGSAMDAVGPDGFVLTVSTALGLFLAIGVARTLWMRGRRPRAPT